MEALVKTISNIFKFHKLKIVTFILSTLIFFVVLFPLNDLSDYISSLIAQGTQNQVFVQFEEMGIDVLPTPGLEMRDVSIDTPQISSLTTETLSVHPSIPAFLSFKPGATAYATGFLGGNAKFFGKILESTPEGSKINLEISTEGMLIRELFKLLPTPGNLKGTLDFDSQGTFDLSFREQPTATMRAKMGAFQIISLSIPTQMGPFPLPTLSLKEVLARMTLENGVLRIEELKLGQKGDPLEASIEGQITINLRNIGGSIQPLPGAYDLSFDMEMQNSLENQLAVLINILSLNKYKRGNKYSFRASGTPTSMPKIKAQ